MKTYFLIPTLFITFTLSFSQVGIGVTNPTQMLEVDGGHIYVGDDFYIMNSIGSYSGDDTGFHIIAADPNSQSKGEPLNGELIEFYGNQELLPITIQAYEIKNVRYHKLQDLNLQIPSDKYVISLSNFEAIPSSGNLGLYRVSRNTSGFFNTFQNFTYSNFVIETSEVGNNWHVRIEAPNVSLSHNTSWTYTYKFDIIIFPKRFFKNLGNLQYNLNGSKNGAAPSAPSGL